MASPAWGLPPPEDTPEEILRTEIITEARSPFDGKPLTAAEYALLEARLRSNPPNTQLNPKVEDLIYLIRLRKLFRSIGIPIK
ncbi:glutathione S-transferase [Merismopedia glauca CCAP 1448/3]|uniref:Glutathione S-transferase n=1 Tax=Merismopedia glauca CCAP 1448/3 TaxID=1296344 RepID=A0A2T1C6K8_9CYAN|nr:glutathione S-transferase [Merismopedia glauca CCAP 1448/3]